MKLSKWSAVDEFLKKSKPSLLRFIMSSLRKMPKKRLAYLAYAIHHEKLPRLKKAEFDPELGYRVTMRKGKLKYLKGSVKKKRKFSRKQLAAQKLFAKRARAGTLRR